MASITKRGKKWQVRYSKRRKIQVKQSDGTFKTEYKLEQVSKSGFNTKREAQEYASKLELQAGQGIDLKNNISFYEYFVNYYTEIKAPQLRPSTLRLYPPLAKKIYNYFGYTAIKDIRRLDYQRFVNSIDESPNALKANLAKIRSCVKYALADKIITDDFTSLITAKGNPDKARKIDYLSVKEIKQLLDYCLSARSTDQPLIYMVIFAIASGARLGEITALTWQDFDFKNNVVSISKSFDFRLKKSGPTKNQSSTRKIVINAETMKVIQELEANNNERVFALPDGSAYPKYRITRNLPKILAAAGLTNHRLVFHSLRHCHVALLHSMGIDWFAISQRLGHNNLNTTLKTYAYLVNEEKLKADQLIKEKMNRLF